MKIEVGSHADAFTLFESLNNRGVPLSALDLIKNNLLAALEKETPESIDENFTKWDETARESFRGLRHPRAIPAPVLQRLQTPEGSGGRQDSVGHALKHHPHLRDADRS